MPAVALSRLGARVVESGPDGEDLAAGAWQRLEALPDPRSPQGRIYPAGLPDRGRGLRLHRRRERPAHRRRAVDQASQSGSYFSCAQRTMRAPSAASARYGEPDPVGGLKDGLPFLPCDRR